MASIFALIILVAIKLIAVCATGSMVTLTDDAVTKRSDGLIRDIVQQMVAEQQERKTILEKFHKMEDQLDDTKRDLKERNTLLHDTKILQKKLKSLVKEFKKEIREQSKVIVKKELNRFRKFITTLSKRLKKEMKVQEQIISKKMSSTNKNLKKFVKMHEKNVERQITKTNQRISQVKEKSVEKIKVINNELVVLKNQFANHTQVKRVAFFVKLSSRYTTTSNVIFKTVMLNIGGGYHSNDGIFYCPIGGLYMFSISLMIDKNYYAGGHIMKNGVQLAYTQSRTYNIAWPSTSLTLMVQLKTGDRIWVKGEGKRYYDYSYFSGSLINL